MNPHITIIIIIIVIIVLVIAISLMMLVVLLKSVYYHSLFVWFVMMMIVLFRHCDLWPSGSMQDTEIKFDILSNKGGPFHILWHTHLFKNYFLNGNENWKKRLIQHGWFLDRSYFTKGLPEGDSTLSYLVTHSLTLSLAHSGMETCDILRNLIRVTKTMHWWQRRK